MAAYARQRLELDTGCDFQLTLTILAEFVPVGLTVTSATLTIAQNPEGAPTLLELTTEADGGLVFGVQDPPNVGAQAANLQELLQLGLTQVTDIPPVPVEASTGTLASLATLEPTDMAAGSIAFVQAGQGAYYAWSPASTLTPNGSTIVQSTAAAGNWVLYGTLTIAIAAEDITPYFEGAMWNCLVSWSDGTVSKLFAGPVEVSQTVGEG